MVRITVELVKKHAEHNDKNLSTLEEISLHQLNIDKIEHLDRWCPKLKILLLQGNLISKIENLSRSRELEYLNLALNNIENVSGLENCESLRKLDLTANFIIDIHSLKTLSGLLNLEELYLTGNPCTDYDGYRCWVINCLPTLKELDGTEIFHSEKLRSKLHIDQVHLAIKEQQSKAFERRNVQKKMFEKEEDNFSDTDEDIQSWNEQMTTNCPEMRTAMSKEIQRRREKHEKRQENKKKKEIKYFANDGRPLNMNKADLDFLFKDDEENNTFVLEVKTYRYLGGEHLSCDVQPHYVRVMVKGLPLQIVYPSEVKPGQSTAVRSQLTGSLVITAPKLNEDILRFPHKNLENPKKKTEEKPPKEKSSNENYLEVSESDWKKRLLQTVSLPEDQDRINPGTPTDNQSIPLHSSNFVDDPEVPPLI